MRKEQKEGRKKRRKEKKTKNNYMKELWTLLDGPLDSLPSSGFAILLLLVLWWRHWPPGTHGTVRVLLLLLGRLQDLC